MRRSNYQSGMRGVYLVAAELTRRGFIASPTLRNAPGADLLVTDSECNKTWSVQVKTNTDRLPYWLVGEKATGAKSPSHVYVFVTLDGKQGPEYIPVRSEFEAKNVCKEQTANSTFYSFDKRLLKSTYNGWEIF